MHSFLSTVFVLLKQANDSLLNNTSLISNKKNIVSCIKKGFDFDLIRFLSCYFLKPLTIARGQCLRTYFSTIMI